jgi:UDP-galactopyranose mutase
MQESINNSDIIVVGSGLFGSVIAERCSRDLNMRVLVIEARNHIGGNCYTEDHSETGINVHKYGPHIFHTSNERVWNYINQFAEFNPFKHQVMSRVGSRLYSIPINLSTINQFFNKGFTPNQAAAFMETQRIPNSDPQNFEEQALALIGKDLYEAFFKGYTIKQWERDPKELPASVARRLPVRFNYNSKYHNDRWEAMPAMGYTPIFERMLTHPNIEVKMNCDYFDIRHMIPDNKLLVYSGPIDRFFDYRYGVLNWRTCDFRWETLPTEDFQGVNVVNYPEAKYLQTRSIEYRHFHPERNYTKNATVLAFEHSRAAGANDTPFYPVNTSKDRKIFALYQASAATLTNTIIGGRLGEYQYYDMHQVIGAALSTYEKRIKQC